MIADTMLPYWFGWTTMERTTEAAKPSLLHKLEGSTNEIHAAVIIPGVYAIILILI